MPKTAAQCIHLAERVETLAQELYAILAEAFAAEPALASLFRRLAAEEGQHALRIRLLERHAGRSPWQPQVLDRVGQDLDAMAREIEELRTRLAGLPSPLDAFSVIAHLASMEERAHAAHAHELAHSAVPEIAHLFRTLAAQDAGHGALLRAARGSSAA
jgi:rubrerythrin